MPGIHRELARDESGAQPVSIFQDFQYVMALFLIKCSQSPIIKDQQIGLSIAGEQFSRKYKLKSLGYDFEKVVERISILFQVEKEYIT